MGFIWGSFGGSLGDACGDRGATSRVFFFQSLYSLNMEVEGPGTSWTTLEATAEVQPTSGEVSISLKDKLPASLTDVRQRLVRYPDWWAPHARQVLRSVVATRISSSTPPLVGLRRERASAHGTAGPGGPCMGRYMVLVQMNAWFWCC